MDEYQKDFVQESEENITELNNALLELERDPGDDEAMGRVFRMAHTLKGNSGAMGFERASNLAHAIEDLLEVVRSGDIDVTSELMDEVFAGVDELETMVDEVRAHGEIRSDPGATIETIRGVQQEVTGIPTIGQPDEEDIEESVAAADDLTDEDHDVFHVRLAVDESGEVAHGSAVVSALADAFDLLGTTPDEATIAGGDYGGTFDAVFGSAVGEAAISAALDPVEPVSQVRINDVTERYEASAHEPATDDGDDEFDDLFDDQPGRAIDADDAQDMTVDDLLSEFDEYDDLDAMVEEMDDVSGFDDLGDAGSFDDLDIGDGFEPRNDPATDPVAEEVSLDEDGEPEADDESEADLEPVEDPDESVEDAAATFAELKREVDPVGFDELQDELDELEFDEYDDEEEVGFDELLGEDFDEEETDFFDQDTEAAVGTDQDEVSVDDLVGDDDVAGFEESEAETPVDPDDPVAADPQADDDGVSGNAAAEPGRAVDTAEASAADEDASDADQEIPDSPLDTPTVEDDEFGGDGAVDGSFGGDGLQDVVDDETPGAGEFGVDEFDLDGADPSGDASTVGEAPADSFGTAGYDDAIDDGGFDDHGDSVPTDGPSTDSIDGDGDLDRVEVERFELDEPGEDAAADVDVETGDFGTEADAGTTGNSYSEFGDVDVDGADGFDAPEPEPESDDVTATDAGVSAIDVDVDIDIQTLDDESTDADGDEEVQSIRVDVEQVDRLLNLVEGLVTSRVRLRRTVEEGADPAELDAELDELEDLTGELQDTVMDVRLVPVRMVANRLPRIVRDVSREQEKDVEFEMHGEDVEIDRSILEEIGDPLVHIVRNAVDHGIEPPEEREAADKPHTGQVSLEVERARDQVVIELSDDGRGLDADRLREAAVEADVLTEAAAESTTDEEAYELIFHPGLSTASEVTGVSGRGVGMDVVESTVEDLDGSVSVESEPGEGTTIRMLLPVTVAIADVLFVTSGDEEFGVPVKDVRDIGVVESVSVEDGREVVHDGDRSYPLVRLDEALETPGRARNGDGMLLHIRDEVRPVAVHCDEVRGQQEVVVKPYEGVLGGIPGLSGATVLGEGEVVNILDVKTL